MKAQPKPKVHGGKREGAGRKPDWFKEKCAALASHEDVLDFLGRVVRGDPIEEKVLNKGSTNPISVMVSASVDSRIHAWEKLCDRGFGKPTQELALPQGNKGRFVLICADGGQ